MCHEDEKNPRVFKVSGDLAAVYRTRYTTGQRVLDATGNLKAVQALFGHASTTTTADTYTDWDVGQDSSRRCCRTLAFTTRGGMTPTRNHSPRLGRKPLLIAISRRRRVRNCKLGVIEPSRALTASRLRPCVVRPERHDTRHIGALQPLARRRPRTGWPYVDIRARRRPCARAAPRRRHARHPSSSRCVAQKWRSS